jgi:DNA helicase-2/ATP-dependent DNA helicase PcrA
MDILSELNQAQREAVETIEGPLLILAGPGSGKTKVITHRIAYLIKTCGVSPHRIMAVTFTNKASRELQERLQLLVGHALEKLTLGTFHAICARILRQDGTVIGLNPKFNIYDEDDQLSLVKQSIQDIGLDPKQYAPKAVQSAIKFAKSQLLTPNDYALHTGSYFEEIVQRVYERYQQVLHQSQTVDFDDLLMKVVQLFNDHEDILSKYQSRYIHLLVDEFQDTNTTQYQLIKQLAGKHHNICVVGDPDQSIYSWRYADLRNILSFERDYPDAKVVLLEQNYRSTKSILDVASSIISANIQRKQKNLITENETGLPVTIAETYNEAEEAQFIVGEIDKLVKEDSISAADCAVMYRINAQSRALEEAFVRHGMPYRLVGGTRFYSRREIKDIIAYLRFIHNPHDNISLMRIINVPGRGIGSRTVSEFTSWAKSQNISLYSTIQLIAEKKGPPLSARASVSLTNFAALMSELIEQSKKLTLIDLIDEVLNKTGYRNYILSEENSEERWENIMALRADAREYDTSKTEDDLTSFLEKVSLVSAEEETEEKSNATTLTTLHQAKGLEFPVVFIVGVEEGLLPHWKSQDDTGELEEERRLFYVGVTRAKKRVYILYTYRRSLFGNSGSSEQSRFLRDIPQELVITKPLWVKEDEEIECTPVTTLYRQPASQSPSRPLNTITVSAGDSIRHAIFGDGVVINCSAFGDDQQATVDFAAAGVKRLLIGLAPVEKLDNN